MTFQTILSDAELNKNLDDPDWLRNNVDLDCFCQIGFHCAFGNYRMPRPLHAGCGSTSPRVTSKAGSSNRKNLQPAKHHQPDE